MPSEVAMPSLDRPSGPAESGSCTLDVRPALARGEEPFGMIMAAVEALAPGQDLVIVAPFEPVPLEGVLGSQGFTFDAVALEHGDWQVTFRRPT